MVKVESYKGHEIWLENGVFEAVKDGETYHRDEKLAIVKKLIDDEDKGRVRCPAFRETYGTEPMLEGQITSITTENKGYGTRYEAWFSWKDDDVSKREKRNLSSLIKATENNKKIIEEINTLRSQEREIDDKVDELRKKLEHFTPSEFYKESEK